MEAKRMSESGTERNLENGDKIGDGMFLAVSIFMLNCRGLVTLTFNKVMNK